MGRFKKCFKNATILDPGSAVPRKLFPDQENVQSTPGCKDAVMTNILNGEEYTNNPETIDAFAKELFEEELPFLPVEKKEAIPTDKEMEKEISDLNALLFNKSMVLLDNPDDWLYKSEFLMMTYRQQLKHKKHDLILNIAQHGGSDEYAYMCHKKSNIYFSNDDAKKLKKKMQDVIKHLDCIEQINERKNILKELDI